MYWNLCSYNISFVTNLRMAYFVFSMLLLLSYSNGWSIAIISIEGSGKLNLQVDDRYCLHALMWWWVWFFWKVLLNKCLVIRYIYMIMNFVFIIYFFYKYEYFSVNWVYYKWLWDAMLSFSSSYYFYKWHDNLNGNIF